MTTIDLSPLYRSSIGFDKLASMLDSSFGSSNHAYSYPPYNIEVLDENRYTITLAVAGFDEECLDLQVEKSVLTVRGNQSKPDSERQYLYHGIANRDFERKFTLADYVEVTNAQLHNGILTINLVKKVPEEMKPKTIKIESEKKERLIEQNKEEAA